MDILRIISAGQREKRFILFVIHRQDSLDRKENVHEVISGDVTLAKDDGKARAEIKDEGPGLTEEDKKKIFGKFQRLSAKPTGGEQSTGLGLSIVKKYVEAMNGKVWCESEQGKGANFIVEFNRVE